MLFSIVSNVISVSSVTCNQCLKCQVSGHKISKNLTSIVDENFLYTIVDENFLSTKLLRSKLLRYNCRWNFFIYNCRWNFLSTIEIVEVIVEVVEDTLRSWVSLRSWRWPYYSLRSKVSKGPSLSEWSLTVFSAIEFKNVKSWVSELVS